MRLTAIILALVACKSAKPADDPQETAEDNNPASDALAKAELASVSVGFTLLDLERALVVTASSDAISVEGMAIVGVRGWAVDAAELEGVGDFGHIPKLTRFIAAVRTQVAVDPPGHDDVEAALLVDRRAPNRLLIELVSSAKRPPAGVRHFALVARADAATVVLRFTLPEGAPPSMVRAPRRVPGGGAGGDGKGDELQRHVESSSGPTPLGEPRPEPMIVGDLVREESSVGMIVTVTKEDVIVWSRSGLEGSMQKPLHVFAVNSTAPARLGRVLQDVVQRRWDGPARPRDDRSILFMADTSHPMSVIAPLLGATRSAPEGGELFPELLLGVFE